LSVEDAIQQLLNKAAEVEPLFKTYHRVQNSKVEAEIEQLANAAAAQGVNKVDLKLNPGNFNGLLTTDLNQISADSTTNLGRMTFNQVAPQTLLVQMGCEEAKATTGLPNMTKGQFEGQEQGYVIYTFFSILPTSKQTDATAAAACAGVEAPIQAVMSAIGQFDVAGPEQPARLLISFKKLRFAPASEKHREAWTRVMKPHNPSMGDDGVLEISLGAAPKGHVDFLVMTPKWHVSRGNMGSVVVMERA